MMSSLSWSRVGSVSQWWFVLLVFEAARVRALDFSPRWGMKYFNQEKKRFHIVVFTIAMQLMLRLCGSLAILNMRTKFDLSILSQLHCFLGAR